MYYMAYFKDEEQKLFLAESDNLLEWADGDMVYDLKDENRIIRDPYLVKDRSGIWHLFFTNQWHGTSVGHSVSDNLRNWAKAKEIHLFPEVGDHDVYNCWAPECYWSENAQGYYLVWSTSFVSQNITYEESNRIWYAFSEDLCHFTKARKLFDPGYPVIDASVMEYGGRYFMAFKDERGFNQPGSSYSAIRTAVAETFHGPYGKISPILTGWQTEGPALLHEDNKFYLFYDAFGEERYRGLVSTDFIHWSDITEKMRFPERCKHLCIVKAE